MSEKIGTPSIAPEPETDQATVGTACELRVRQQRYDRSGKAEDVVVESLNAGPTHSVDAEYGKRLDPPSVF